MSVLIFILVNSKDKLNQKKEKVRDFTPIYSELSRKHKLVSSVWTAIDTKIGVLLGLIVVWLLGIIRSKDIISSIANNTHFNTDARFYARIYIKSCYVYPFLASFRGLLLRNMCRRVCILCQTI